MRGMEDLIAKWRYDRDAMRTSDSVVDVGHRHGLKCCADELESAIAAMGGEAVATVENALGTGVLIPKWIDSLPENPSPEGTKLFTHPADEMVVTDEMVEVACENIWPDFWESHVNTDDLKVARREYMRAALTAAARLSRGDSNE